MDINQNTYQTMPSMEVESTMTFDRMTNGAIYAVLELLPIQELFLLRRVSRRLFKVVNRYVTHYMRTMFIPMMSLQQVKMMLFLLTSLQPSKLKVIIVEADRIKSMIGKFPTLMQQTKAVFALEDVCYCQSWWSEINLPGLESFCFDYGGLIMNIRLYELMSIMPDLKILTIRNLNLATKWSGLDNWLLELLNFCPNLTAISLFNICLYSTPVEFTNAAIQNVKRVHPKLRINVYEDPCK